MRHLFSFLCLFAVVTTARTQSPIQAAMLGSSPTFGDVVSAGSYYLPANDVGQPNGAFYWLMDGEFSGGSAIGFTKGWGSPFMFSWFSGMMTGDLGTGEWLRLGLDGDMRLNLPAVTVGGTISASSTISSAGAPVARWRGSAESDPADPRGGDTYKNTTSGKIRIYDDAAWVDLN